jgi:rod shape-determining protein MreD
VKRVVFVGLMMIAIVLQLSFLPALRPFGVVPDLLLAIVVLAGLEGTASLALITAVAGGLAMDLASGANFGMWTGILLLAALATGLVHRAGLELGSGVVAVVLVAAGTLLSALVILLGLVSVTSHWPVAALVGNITAELVLNLILTIGLQPLVRWAVPGEQPGVIPVG